MKTIPFKTVKTTVLIEPMKTVKRNGVRFVVNPFSHELRPLNPPPGAYFEISPNLERRLRRKKAGIRQPCGRNVSR